MLPTLHTTNEFDTQIRFFRQHGLCITATLAQISYPSANKLFQGIPPLTAEVQNIYLALV